MQQNDVTLKNIRPYLDQLRAKGFLRFRTVQSIEEIKEHSNVGYLFRFKLTTANGQKRRLVLKQSRSTLKRNHRGRKPVQGLLEMHKYRYLQRIIPHSLPEIPYGDPQRALFIMSDVSWHRRHAVRELAAGRLWPTHGKILGALMGNLHGKTFGTAKRFNTAPWQRWVAKKWYREWVPFGTKKFLPARSVGALVARSFAAPASFIWGDPLPKNFFFGKKDVKIIDFDFAQHFDPAFDVGVLLAHWLIHSEKPSRQKAARRFIRGFLSAYNRTLRVRGLNTSIRTGISHRAFAWLGMYLLSRTDGKSGSYFRNTPKWEKAIRHTGLAILGKGKTATANWIQHELRPASSKERRAHAD